MTTVRPQTGLSATGPTGPQNRVPRPETTLGWFRPAQPARVWFLGAHGGAGETTLAGLMPGAAAADHRWPAATPPAPVVLVARTSAAGLLAARAAAMQWAAAAAPPAKLHGLVLSADAPGRLPKPLRELAELVAGGVPRVWHLPWIEAWRTGDDASPKLTSALIDDLTQLLAPERTSA